MHKYILLLTSCLFLSSAIANPSKENWLVPYGFFNTPWANHDQPQQQNDADNIGKKAKPEVIKDKLQGVVKQDPIPNNPIKK